MKRKKSAWKRKLNAVSCEGNVVCVCVLCTERYEFGVVAESIESLKSFAVSAVVLVYDAINSIVPWNKEMRAIRPPHTRLCHYQCRCCGSYTTIRHSRHRRQIYMTTARMQSQRGQRREFASSATAKINENGYLHIRRNFLRGYKKFQVPLT